MSRWLYYLLGLAVIAPLIDLIWGPQQVTAIFIFSAIGLIPLAGLIGRATEDLEYHVGPIAGGLLNASFGNAPEIIIGIFAIQHGLITVVKASITGSIISNSLLVLVTCCERSRAYSINKRRYCSNYAPCLCYVSRLARVSCSF